MGAEQTDNYIKLCHIWREKFLTWDHEKAMKNVGLADGVHEEYLELDYFGVPFRIDRKTGVISDTTNPGKEQSFNTQMCIYHLLYYAVDGPELSGEWVPFRDVPTTGVFDGAYQNTILKPFAEVFSGKADALKKAGEKLNFLPLSYGDVSFQADAFRCLPMRIIFWDGDDEYPAQANMLFDANITQFLHPETVVCLAGQFASRLIEAARLEVKPGTIA